MLDVLLLLLLSLEQKAEASPRLQEGRAELSISVSESLNEVTTIYLQFCAYITCSDLVKNLVDEFHVELEPQITQKIDRISDR